MSTTEEDKRFLAEALAQARESFREGGIPIGAVLVRGGEIVATGHNKRVQDNDPTAHGEMDCIRAAGRQTSYRGMSLYTTLSPCMMCAGTIVQFGIRHVIIGEATTFSGNIEFLKHRGINVLLIDDTDCKELMQRFMSEHFDLWKEDIGET